MFHELYSDFLYELKGRLPVLRGSAIGPFEGNVSSSPSLCFLQALEVVLPLQLGNEGIVGSNLSLGGEVQRYWRCHTVLLELSRRRHGGFVDGSFSLGSTKVRRTLSDG